MAADSTATFAVNLEDGTSDAAISAAKALQTLRDQIDGDTKALAQMQRAMKNLQGGASVNINQFKQLKAAIDAKKQAIATAQGSIMDLGGSLTRTGGSAKGLTSLLDRLKAASQAVPGPVGGIVGKFGNLKSILSGGAIAFGIVAIVSALALLVVGAAAATAALLKYGIAQADARRSELLRLEGLTKMRNMYGLVAGNATEMQNAIDKVSGSTALGRDQVAGYSNQLYKMGLRGDNLTAALEGVVIKASVFGDAAGTAFGQIAAGAQWSGMSIRKLTDDVKARLGGVATSQMLSLGVQAAKLRENFGLLFKDLKIEGLLKSLHMVTSLFSQSTASGRALKTIIEVVFQPMINAIEFLGPYVKRFFQGMIIGALRIIIVLLQVRNWFRKAFGDSEVLKGFDATRLALLAGEAAVWLLGAAFVGVGALIVGALAAAMPFIWAAVAALGSLALAGLALAAPFILGAIAVGALIMAGYQLYRLWKEIDWKSLGTAIVDGIVKGLKSGSNWVINTVKNLGKEAMASFKSILGIASPSKAFAKMGLNIPQGVEMGIAKGQPSLNRKVSDMVNVPQTVETPSFALDPEPASTTSNKSSSDMSVSIGEMHFHTTAETAKDMAVDIKQQLIQILEGVAISMGAPIPGNG